MKAGRDVQPFPSQNFPKPPSYAAFRVQPAFRLRPFSDMITVNTVSGQILNSDAFRPKWTGSATSALKLQAVDYVILFQFVVGI